MSDRPRIEIEYCTQCRWLLRAAWTAQELLTTFEAEIGGVTLVPAVGGVFDVRTAEASPQIAPFLLRLLPGAPFFVASRPRWLPRYQRVYQTAVVS